MENLSQAEQDLFKDTAIEAAYQAWASDRHLTHSPRPGRKAFLMRIRALVQSGAIKRKE